VLILDGSDLGVEVSVLDGVLVVVGGGEWRMVEVGDAEGSVGRSGLIDESLGLRGTK